MGQIYVGVARRYAKHYVIVTANTLQPKGYSNYYAHTRLHKSYEEGTWIFPEFVSCLESISVVDFRQYFQ